MFSSKDFHSDIKPSYKGGGFFEGMPWWVVAIFIIVILYAVVLTVITINERCISYEDLCYHEVCYFNGKFESCTDKPISCSSSDVIGHKQFCTMHKFWWEK